MTTMEMVVAAAAGPVPRETESKGSLPACLDRITADGHKPSLIIGMVSGGDWLPPVALSEVEAAALSGALATAIQVLEPADPVVTRALLSSLAMNCRLEDLPDKIWQMHLNDFVSDLSDVPENVIADACRVWRRRKKFWPVISEFLELVRPELARRRQTLRRLQVLDRVASDPAPDRTATREWIDRVVGPHAALSRTDGMRPLGRVLDQASLGAQPGRGDA